MITMSNRKSYIGEEINGFKILEEIDQEFPSDYSQQRKHQSRLFWVIHLETEVVMKRTLGTLRSYRLKRIDEYERFNDLTGLQLSHYTVLGLSENSIHSKKLGRSKNISWRCLDSRTNTIKDVQSALLITLRNYHK